MNTLTLLELLLLLPLCLLLEGFFSGSEIAIISADKVRLRSKAQQGSLGARCALKLLEYPERVFATTLVMTTLCITAISILTTLFALQHFKSRGQLYAVLISTPLVLIFGELIPKTIFKNRSELFAPLVSRVINVTYYILFPITVFISSYTSRISRAVARVEDLMGGKQKSFRDELRSLITAGKSETKIKSSERRMLKRIFDFKDTEAKHTLIPLVKVNAIEESSSVKEALERFRDHRHSRMPIFRDRVDHIVGLIEITDLFTVQDLEQPIKNFLTPVRFIAETHALDELLDEMKREDEKLVVVVDEYGGAVGILTLEDILEEIVGEIDDEYDTETSSPYREIEPGVYVLNARIEIAYLNDALKLDLPEGDYETLSGFMLQQFGRIPESGDELYFDTSVGTLKFIVRKATDRRIESVLIEKPKNNNA